MQTHAKISLLHNAPPEGNFCLVTYKFLTILSWQVFDNWGFILYYRTIPGSILALFTGMPTCIHTSWMSLFARLVISLPNNVLQSFLHPPRCIWTNFTNNHLFWVTWHQAELSIAFSRSSHCICFYLRYLHKVSSSPTCR